ncbi:MAG: SusC/RagA family TonB-linked outer membrane protein [Bacteroidia bacterium]|nr:SusC/RagA family TonB-linked outer membrane protein [Bacteroidia bacterium]
MKCYLNKKHKQDSKQQCRSKFLTLLFIFLFISYANVYSQSNLTLNMKDVSLRQVFNEIEKKSDYVFLFSNSLKDEAGKKINIDISSENIEEILTVVTKNTGIVYEILGKQVILYKNSSYIAAKPGNESTQPSQNSIVINGIVKDEDGYEIPGATIIIAETNRGTATDIDGKFTLTLTPDEKTLIISYVGMKRLVVPIGNKTSFEIQLKHDQEMLKELIVTGYQTISKEQSTGSYVSISPYALEGKLQTNIMSRLEGQVPGLIKNNKGELSLRGIVSLKGQTQPLLVVDGTPFEGDIKSINPSIIDNITILKDAAAASIYGARAANGVIVISTKRGTMDGRTHVSYDGSVRITGKPDINYLNLINSKELVDVQIDAFRYNTQKWDDIKLKRELLDPVSEMLYKHRANLITNEDLNKGLDLYRSLDNKEQVVKEFLRSSVVHQHNVTLTSGNEKSRYIATVNYMGDYGSIRHQKDEQLGFTFRNNIQFFPWLKSDFGVAGSFTTHRSENGMLTLSHFLSIVPSYYMLRDKDGKPTTIPYSKKKEELERLIRLGLKDESYNPIRNRAEETTINKNNYYRVHAGFNVKLNNNLNLDLNYQTEYASGKNKNLKSEHSHYIRNMINDAAQIEPETNRIIYNIPEGGYMREKRNDMYAYTMRAQLNYSKNKGNHYLSGLLGAERRLMRTTGTNSYYFGYDDTGIGFQSIDPNKLSRLVGTESLDGSFQYNIISDQWLEHIDDRFISFYGNAAYSYAGRYKLTGSIRIDQSNLFGTDPKYQYRPLWSVGAGWNIMQEKFMQSQKTISSLELRASYGIGGNIPKDVGPYLTLKGPMYNEQQDAFELSMLNPANPELRWEKTASTNIGLDFGFLDNRIGGTIEYYNKYTTDLLGTRETDATHGFSSRLRNYGTMSNTGIEVSLNTINVLTDNFSWNTIFNFSYNKNKLIDVYDAEMNVSSYLNNATFVKGYPAFALFSTKFAGLDTAGAPLYYTAKGEKTSQPTSINDLVYSGTTVPPYSASFTSNFNYKNFGLSLLFVYYGGHIIRDVSAPYTNTIPTLERTYNVTKEILNRWQKPGDENKPETTPAFSRSMELYETGMYWQTSDRHILKGDYIKLRDISFTYSFEQSLFKKWNIESMMATLQIQDIAYWYANKKNFDPETASIDFGGRAIKSLRQSPSCTIGLSINF